VSLRKAIQAMLPRTPAQEIGDPCRDCGTVLVLCVQCGAEPRCLECLPYERPTEHDEKISAAVRLARDHPHAGVMGGAFAALVPAMLVWAQTTYVPPGVLRTVGTLAGAVACCTFLAAGAAAGKLPLPGEVPECRRHDYTPYDRWALAGIVALVVQVALVSVGIAAA
jgi:hypothetical protein